MLEYKFLFLCLAFIKKKINIIIIGANDGRINDPSYEMIIKYSNKTDVLLIEPNPSIIPYLKKNYRLHPSHQIVNCAIGGNESLNLYAIKRSMWEYFKPSYAKNWPTYRAPTGVTSAIKSNVAKALKAEGLDEHAIEKLTIKSKKLKTLCSEIDWKLPIDILQIDVEGYENVVLFSSKLDEIDPKIIIFEHKHIERKDKIEIVSFLIEKKYDIYHSGVDFLAIKRNFSFYSYYNRIIIKIIFPIFANSK